MRYRNSCEYHQFLLNFYNFSFNVSFFFTELSDCTKSLFKSYLEEETKTETLQTQTQANAKTPLSESIENRLQVLTNIENQENTEGDRVIFSTSVFQSILVKETNTPTPPHLASMDVRTMFKPPITPISDQFNSTFEVCITSFCTSIIITGLN